MLSTFASGTGTPVAAFGPRSGLEGCRRKTPRVLRGRNTPSAEDPASADAACGPVGSVWQHLVGSIWLGSVRATICAAGAPGLGGVRGRGAETIPAGAGGATSAVTHVSGAGAGRSSVGAAAPAPHASRVAASGNGEAAAMSLPSGSSGPKPCRPPVRAVCSTASRRALLCVVLRGARLDQNLGLRRRMRFGGTPPRAGPWRAVSSARRDARRRALGRSAHETARSVEPRPVTERLEGHSRVMPDASPRRTAASVLSARERRSSVRSPQPAPVTRMGMLTCALDSGLG